MKSIIKLGMATAALAALAGCGGGHDTSSKHIVPTIESYKATLGTIESCAKQIEGAKLLLEDASDIYDSKAFKKYVESSTREILKAEKNCDKYERYKSEPGTSPEVLEKLKDTVAVSVKSALTVVENGISQQEAYKSFQH